MTMSEKLIERKSLFNDAIQFKPVKRIPAVSNAWTWKIIDSDLKPKLSEALSDYNLMESVVREHHERYEFDTYIDLGVRNNFNVSKALGHSQHVIDDENFSIYALDETIISDDGFDDYIKDPDLYVWEKVGPMYFKDMTYGNIEDAIRINSKYVEYVTKISNAMVNDYGVPLIGKTVALHPLENILNSGRGIKNFSVDLRRRPDKLIAITDVKAPAVFKTIESSLNSPSDNYAFDMRITMLMHSLTNTKQFETIMWPFIKKALDMANEKNKTIFLFVEASILRLSEFFDEFKKGQMVMLNEMDDIFELRKRLPNLALCGGMPVNMLQYSTKEECKDYAKLLIDKMGEGYVFSQNKMMSFLSDGKRENMLAVNEIIKETRG